MSKLNFSIVSKYSKLILFFTLFLALLLLIFPFLSNEKSTSYFQKKNLRRLGVEEYLFKVLSVFNYFFYPFFLLSFCAVPWLNCLIDDDPEQDIIAKRVAFFGNKICYIINTGYLVSSCANFIFGVEEKYSLSILICSSLYFIIHSIFYISCCNECKEKCFPGICQWKFLGNMYKAPCCFFYPCKNKEEEENEKGICKEINKCCEECCCCVCIISSIGGILYLTNVTCYYVGLLIYSLFWLIGKFFVFISCCDCWLKEKYDVDDFMITQTSDTSLAIPDVPQTKEENKVKEIVEKIISEDEQKEIKNVSKGLKSLFSKIIKGKKK